MEEKPNLKINLNNFCRACLCENDNMKLIISPNDNLFERFKIISGLIFEINEDNLPFIICQVCEEKLDSLDTFREQCQNSHKLLTEYCERVQKAELIDSAGVESESENENSEIAGKPGKVSRLVRYSHNTVTQAIENTKKQFYENPICIRCGFTGSNMRALSVHVSHVHKDLKDRWCYKCNGEFGNLSEHLKSHDFLLCEFCNKQFQGKGHLTEHLLSHSDLRPFQCSYCKKCFISQRHLNVHLPSHTNEKPYKCNLCTKSYNQYYGLRKHHKQHKKSNVILTPQNFCDKCNKNVRSLNAHMKKIHSVIDSMDTESRNDNKLCTVCGKQFKSVSKLKIHMRIHTGETPYKCSYCEKSFTTRYQLIVHERTHTGERPHVCHICGKNFSQSSVLNTHMRRHTGRPIACNICDQRFCRPAELQLHLRKHTGEKPYLCSECGQSFIQRSHLVEHNKTHSDLRPYQCNYCDKAFKQSSSLKSHVQIHLGEKPFKCDQCSYACRQSYSLTQHMKQHNRDASKREGSHSCTMCNTVFKSEDLLTSHFNNVHNVMFLNL